MKRILQFLIIFTIMVFALSGCSSEASSEKNSSKEKNTFTVGFDSNFPPFGYVGEDGEYTGFDLDMAAEVASRNNWELKLQPIDWNAKDSELDSGTIDCIWNGFTINEREDDYTWTDAYMDNSQVVVVKKSSGIESLKDLAGKVVTAQTDSAALNALRSEDFADLLASFKDLVVCSQYNAAFMDLEAGAVDAIAMDIGVAKFQIEGRESEFMILEEEIVSEQYGVGFKLGNTELRDKVQATLMEMVKDGTFERISNEWFGYNVCTLEK